MIVIKDLLASGLSLEFITAFNKMLEEFKKDKIGSLGLDKFILNNKLSIQQNRLIVKYFMQNLWEKLV